MTRLEECANKVERVRTVLRENGLDGVIIKKQPNFSWITAGARGFIGLASEGSCGSIVVTTKDVYLASNNIETPRLLAEELPHGFAEPVVLPWEEDGTTDAVLRQKLGKLADDGELDGWFRQERVNLLGSEVERYADAGKTVAEILENVCLSLKSGVSEFEVAGMISSGLWAVGIEPITMLVAADDRSKHFRHNVPTNGKVTNGVICSLCARAGGLVISTTRSVAFNKDFAQRYEALLQVENVAFTATTQGAKLGEVLGKIKNAYTQNGLDGEYKNHHQGGLTGYLAREVRVDSTCQKVAQPNQAFAWNPSAVGAKCEDTVLLQEEGIRILTPCSAKWPAVQVGKLLRPDVLRK